MASGPAQSSTSTGVRGPEHWADGRQPFAALSGYELRHLVAHLTQAARANDVYRLVTLETPDGRNAWFDAKELAKELSSYITDIETATFAVRHATQAAT